MCVRDLALPLIFLIAEDTAGAGMMRGVFVLSLSTLRPLPPSAPTRGAGKAAARTRGEATKRNACATSVAPGVPFGSGRPRPAHAAEPHAPLHDHFYWSE